LRQFEGLPADLRDMSFEELVSAYEGLLSDYQAESSHNRVHEALLVAFHRDSSMDGILRAIEQIVEQEWSFARVSAFWFDSSTETMRRTCDLGAAPETMSSVMDLWKHAREQDRQFIVGSFDDREDLSQAILFLTLGSQLVGCIAVEQEKASGPIAESDVEELLPLEGRAAAAVYAAQLYIERETVIRQQRRMMEISLAIASNEDTEMVFKMVRSAIIEIGRVDRAAVWIVVENTAHGTWGTSVTGEETNEQDMTFGIMPGGKYFTPFANPDQPFVIDSVTVTGPKGERWEDVAHAYIPFRVRDELIGIVTVDTLLTGNAITPAMLTAVIPIVDQAAVAIQKARLASQQRRVLLQQRRVMDIAIAIADNEDPDAVLRLVRDATLETGLVDRAGVWIVEGMVARGTWGTDEEGKPYDEHGMAHRLESFSTTHSRFWSGEDQYIINPGSSVTLKTGETIRDVPFGVLGLRAGGQLVGLITFDTMFTKRALTPERLDMILPLAKQAAVVVLNARLRQDRETVIAQQRRLMEISAAVASNEDPDAVLRMVRDAILETGSVDRAGVWLVDGDIARGTWGTDDHGLGVDEHDLSFPLADFRKAFHDCMVGDEAFAIDVLDVAELKNGEKRFNVPYAVIPLRAGKTVVGIVTVDTVRTMREITADRFEMIFPLARQAAVVVQNIRLLAEAKQEIALRTDVETVLKAQAEELTSARDAALAATKAKSEFLANMSHEIRTPMNGVVGMTSLLMQTGLTPDQLGYALGVQRSADALLTVINDILMFSRLEAGMLRIERQEFNLRVCIQDVAEMIASQMKRDSVELSSYVPLDFPEWLVGDGNRVRQVITNLLGNAIKFTQHGEVTIQASCLLDTETEAKVRIEVIDTGVGIAPDRQKAVFESFTQVDGSPTRRYGGSGLGLAITKQIVELMGGTIDLKSDLGAGSNFWIDLTFEKQPALEVGDTKKAVTDLKSSVLIVAPGKTQLKILSDYTHSLGYRPVAVDSGLLAIQSAQSADEPFSYVLIDRDTPDIRPLELLTQLRDISSTKDSRVVLLVGIVQRAQSEVAKSPGFASVLTKPIRLSRLRDALSGVQSKSSAKVASKPERAQNDLKGLRVLLAEDNLVNATVAGGRLGMWDCVFTIAETGREALTSFESEVFDIVLMDVSMPDMDGMQATREIRRRESDTGGHTPIIAMTAYALEGDKEQCLASGMDDFVSKPVNFDELYEKLKHWSGR